MERKSKKVRPKKVLPDRAGTALSGTQKRESLRFVLIKDCSGKERSRERSEGEGAEGVEGKGRMMGDGTGGKGRRSGKMKEEERA